MAPHTSETRKRAHLRLTIGFDCRAIGSKMPTNAVKVSAAEGSIVVRAPIGSVYRRWLRVENFPKFVTAVKEVHKIDATHFFMVVADNGKRHHGLLEIMLRVPERRVAWRVLSGRSSCDQLATGVVSFASRSDGSTCVTLKISSTFNGDVSHRMDTYLHNFKRLIEEQTGESENVCSLGWGSSQPLNRGN